MVSALMAPGVVALTGALAAGLAAGVAVVAGVAGAAGAALAAGAGLAGGVVAAIARTTPHAMTEDKVSTENVRRRMLINGLLFLVAVPAMAEPASGAGR